MSYRRLLITMAGLLGAAVLVGVLCLRTFGSTQGLDHSRLLEIDTVICMAGMYAAPQAFGSLFQVVLWGILLVVGVVALLQTRRSEFWFLAILIALPVPVITVVSKLTLSYVSYRYGLAAFPLVCLIAACSWRLGAGRRFARTAAMVIIIAYSAAGVGFVASAQENTFAYQDWKAAAKFLAARRSPADPILVIGEPAALSLSYYLKQPPALQSVETAADVGTRLEYVLRPPNASASQAWVLLHTFASTRLAESVPAETAPQREQLTSILQKRGLQVCQTAAFKRVEVLAVRHGSCPEPQ